MTFCIVGPFYPLRGGIAQYIGVLGQKLIDRGHRVKVLSFRKQFPKFLFPGQTQIESSREHIALDSLQIFTPWNPLTWLRTFLQVKRDKPDAVIFKFWMPFFAPGFAAVCALIKWCTKVRTIFILDNVIPHEKRFSDKFLTRLVFRWVDCFIVQSEVVKNDLFKWFPEAEGREVQFVPHPVYDCYSGDEISLEESRQKLQIDIDTRLLLFFGLVREYKGLDVLLNAIPHIVDKLGQKVHLVIAGEFYEPETKYQQIIERLNIGQFVTIHNRYIANEDVSLYFQSADVLVLPYRSATQSGVIQVASNFKLPVISTEVGGLPEVIDHGRNGFLVPPEDPEALAEAIVEFFKGDLSEKIRRNLDAEGEDESWEKMMLVMES